MDVRQFPIYLYVQQNFILANENGAGKNIHSGTSEKSTEFSKINIFRRSYRAIC
jgi:hypothetical protein